MEPLNGTHCDDRRLLCGFSKYGVASGETCRDLACENRKREVPWADGGPDATRCCALTGLGRVVAQEINRFAQFGDGVGQAFACFAGEDSKYFAGVGLVSVCSRVQGCGARVGVGCPRFCCV